jgi:membrane protease subunit (stomatin/prohibitin family)
MYIRALSSISQSRYPTNVHIILSSRSTERFTGDLSVSERGLISPGLESASTGSSGIWNASTFLAADGYSADSEVLNFALMTILTFNKSQASWRDRT